MRERKVLLERQEMQRKQSTIEDICIIDPSFGIDVNKLIVMSLTDLLRRKNLIKIHLSQLSAAQRL